MIMSVMISSWRLKPGVRPSTTSLGVVILVCGLQLALARLIQGVKLGGEVVDHQIIRSTRHDVDGFVGREGKSFVLNGEPYYVNGWNSYWLMTQAVELHTRPRVVSILQHGAALGMTVCRTWAFNDASYDALQTTPGAYSEKTFQALDFVIAEAGKRGVRLLLTLVNNLPEYGGKSRYVQWARDTGDDLDHNHDDHFFTHPRIRGFYKAHVKMVLTRVNSITKVEYRNDPAIFGWELINEPRCSYEANSNSLQEWIEEMAAYVKSLDGKHLLTVGLEGFYKRGSRGTISANPEHTPRSGTDFIANHQVEGIDFATVHAYPDLWMPWEGHGEKRKFFDAWVKAHIEDGDEILGMPVLFSEFGLADRQHREAIYKTMYDMVYESAKRRGAGGGALAWQLLDADMARVWNDGFAIFPADQDNSMARLMKRQSCRLNALALLLDHQVSTSTDQALFRACFKAKITNFPQSPIRTRHFEAAMLMTDQYQLDVAP